MSVGYYYGKPYGRSEHYSFSTYDDKNGASVKTFIKNSGLNKVIGIIKWDDIYNVLNNENDNFKAIEEQYQSDYDNALHELNVIHIITNCNLYKKNHVNINDDIIEEKQESSSVTGFTNGIENADIHDDNTVIFKDTNSDMIKHSSNANYNVKTTDAHNDGLIKVPWADLSMNKPGSSITHADINDYARDMGIQGEIRTADVIKAGINDNKYGGLLNSVLLIDKRDIDHVYVCNHGVFIINSKNYKNKILVNGTTVSFPDTSIPDNHDWIDSIMNDADMIKSRLMNYGYSDVIDRIPIIPVFSVMNGVIIFNNPPVSFIDTSMISDYILSKPFILSDELTVALYDDMRRSTFWRK